MADSHIPVDETLELAGMEQIQGYTKTINGKVVQVKSHTRTNNEMSQAANKAPGRPGMAAQAGSFAGGRSLPGVWSHELQKKAEELEGQAPVEEDVEPAPKNLTEAATAMFETLKEYEDTPAARKLKALLADLDTNAFYLSMEETDALELARGLVNIKGYTRVIQTEHGPKVIHVKAYRQIRALTSFLGGPKMAARKGFTTDLMANAMAESSRIRPAGKLDAVRKSVNAPKVSVQSRKVVEKAKGRMASSKPTVIFPPDARSVGDVKYFDSKSKSWVGKKEWVGKNGNLTPSMQTEVDNQAKKVAKERKLPENAFLEKVDTPKPETPKVAEQPKPTTPEVKTSPPSKPPTPATPEVDTRRPEEKTRAERDVAEFERRGGWVSANGRGRLTKAEIDQVDNNDLEGLYRWESGESDERPDASMMTERAWRMGYRKPQDFTPPEKPGQEPIGPRTFVHATGQEFTLDTGEVLMKHKMNEQSLAVFDETGQMKYRIMPNGNKGAVPKNFNRNLWNPADDSATFVPNGGKKTAPKGPNTPPNDGPKMVGGTFIHPKGTRFEIQPGEKVLRHKLVPDSYRVVGSDGEFKYRIMPKGKASYVDTKSGGDFYEDIPEFTPKTEEKTPNVKVPDTPEAPKTEKTPDIAVPETPQTPKTPDSEPKTPEVAEKTPTTPVYDQDKPEAWNAGVGFMANGGALDNTLGRLEELYGEGYEYEQFTNFKEGALYFTTQKAMWDALEDGKVAPEGFVFNNRLFPEGNTKMVEANKTSNPNRFTADDVRAMSQEEQNRFVKDYTASAPKTFVDNQGNSWTQLRSNTWVNRDGDKVLGGWLLEKYLPEPISQKFDTIGSESGAAALTGLAWKPHGSILEAPDGTQFSVEFRDFGREQAQAFVNGKEVDKKTAQVLLDTYMVRGVQAKSVSHTHMKQAETVTELAKFGTLAKIPDILHKSLLSNIKLGDPEADKRVQVSPAVAYVVSDSTLPQMHVPSDTLDRFGAMTTPDPNSLNTARIRSKDLMGTTLDGDVPASWTADVGGAVELDAVINHEAGHMLEYYIDRVLPEGERVSMFKDMAQVLVNALPEQDRDGFPDYVPGVGMGKHTYFNKVAGRNTYSNRTFEEGAPDYDFARALEYAMATNNGAIPTGLSLYSTTNTHEIIAEAWSEFVLNPNPRPIAQGIGSILEKAMGHVGGRLEAVRDGKDYNKSYVRVFSTVGAVGNNPDVVMGKIVSGKGENLRSDALGLEGMLKENTGVSTHVDIGKNGAMSVSIPGKTPRVMGLKVSESRGTGQTFTTVTLPEREDIKLNMIHDELVKQFRYQGVSRMRTEGSLNAARLGYDFSPITALDDIERIFEGMRERGDAGKLTVADRAKFDEMEAQFLERLKNGSGPLPTPYEFSRLLVGDKSLVELTPWKASMTLKPTSTIPTQPSAMLKAPPVDGDVPDFVDTRQADLKMLRKTPLRELEALMEDHDLSDVPGADIREKVTNLTYGSALGMDKSERARVASEAVFIIKENGLTVESPKGLPGWTRWLDRNPELDDAINTAFENWDDINQRLRHGPKPSKYQEGLDEAFKKAPRLNQPLRIWIPVDRQTLIPEDYLVKDPEFSRGTITKPQHHEGAYMSVLLGAGTQVLWDGEGYVLPRGTQFDVIGVSEDEDDMTFATVLRGSKVADPTKFIRPPYRSRTNRKRAKDYTREEIMNMTVENLAALFFGIGIPPEIYIMLLERFMTLPLELLWS